MKVKELASKLEELDPESDVVCYCEEDRGFRLFEIETVTTQDAERTRLEDGTPYLRLGKSGSSVRLSLLEITADF